MEDKFQIKTLPDGVLQIRLAEPMTLAELMEALHVSKEREKKITVSGANGPIINRGLPITDKVVTISQPASEDIEMSFEPVDIVYEDDYCVVADKPPFLLVHDDGSAPDNLQSRVNAYLSESGWPFAVQAVNRIDREASGLVLLCKNPLFQNWFDRQLEERTASKEYLAVVDGLLERKHIDINNPIGKNRHEAEKMIVYAQGKPSHTHLERMARRGKRTLVKANITTGRKHQIRVHASHQGYPIVNDNLYGKKADDRGLLLQSKKLVFEQPVSGQSITVEIPMDTRFTEFAQKRPKKRR